LVAEDATTVTLGWDQQGADTYGFRFFRNGTAVSVTFNPNTTSVRFAKGDNYAVQELLVGDRGEYPGAPPPPVDVCPNIPGDQATIPPGMIKDANGNCVTPPSGN